MSSVRAQKTQYPDASASRVETREDLFEDMQKHASGCCLEANSSDLDDWLDAQRDLVVTPKSQLFDTGTEFLMKLAVPNIEAKDIVISALPESIVVQTQSTRRSTNEGDARCAVFGATRILRRFDLLPGIDVEKTKAFIANGILTIVAPKLPEVNERKIPIIEYSGQACTLT